MFEIINNLLAKWNPAYNTNEKDDAAKVMVTCKELQEAIDFNGKPVTDDFPLLLQEGQSFHYKQIQYNKILEVLRSTLLFNAIRSIYIDSVESVGSDEKETWLYYRAYGSMPNGNDVRAEGIVVLEKPIELNIHTITLTVYRDGKKM